MLQFSIGQVTGLQTGEKGSKTDLSGSAVESGASGKEPSFLDVLAETTKDVRNPETDRDTAVQDKLQESSKSSEKSEHLKDRSDDLVDPDALAEEMDLIAETDATARDLAVSGPPSISVPLSTADPSGNHRHLPDSKPAPFQPIASEDFVNDTDQNPHRSTSDMQTDTRQTPIGGFAAGAADAETGQSAVDNPRAIADAVSNTQPAVSDTIEVAGHINDSVQGVSNTPDTQAASSLPSQDSRTNLVAPGLAHSDLSQGVRHAGEGASVAQKTFTIAAQTNMERLEQPPIVQDLSLTRQTSTGRSTGSDELRASQPQAPVSQQKQMASPASPGMKVTDEAFGNGVLPSSLSKVKAPLPQSSAPPPLASTPAVTVDAGQVVRSEADGPNPPVIHPKSPPITATASPARPAIPGQTEVETSKVVARQSFALDAETLPEVRGVTDLSTQIRATSDRSISRADLPRHISTQMAEAMQRGGSRPVELHLNPVELGRVKMSVQTLDGSVVVHVIADRPETLDLMRRHADLLANDFRSIGYGKAEFSFAQQGSGKGNQALNTSDDGQYAEQVNADASETINAADTEIPAPALHISDRVDVRI